MARPVAERLQAGILAAKGGGLDHARQLLTSVVVQEPSNEKAWYWLGITLTSQAERAWCFKRALELNPGNIEARQQLDGLAFDMLRESGVSPEEVSDLDVDGIIAEKPKVVLEAEAEKAAEAANEPPVEPVPPAGPAQASIKPFYDEEEGTHTPSASQAQNTPAPGPFNIPIEPAEKPSKPVLPQPETIPLKKTGPLQNRPEDGDLQELRKTASFSAMNTATEIRRPPVNRRVFFIAAAVLVIAGIAAVLLLGRNRPPAVTALQPTLSPSPAASIAPAVAATQVSARPTPAPTATLTLQRRVEAIQASILVAQDHAKAGRFTEAASAWTDLIAKVPDYASLYLWRAESTLAEAQMNAESLEAYQQALDDAFQDLDQAELLDSSLPGVKGMRAKVEMASARSTSDPAARTTWLEQASSHANEAISAHQADEEVTLIPYYVLMAQGHCKEALAALASANPLGASEDTISTGWHTVLAAGYMCAGQNGTALTEINLALVQSNTERQTLKALIFYNLGMYQEAIDSIDAWIAAAPSVRSDRYLIRALAYLDRGKRTQAADDLKAGQAESWDMDGIGLFVQGRLTAMKGDTKGAISLYRESIKRMRQDYAPLLRRVHNYLGGLTGP